MDISERSNAALFLGSGVLAMFFQIIAYLGISSAQVYALLFVFCFSGFAGLVKVISFRENLRAFICFDITSKGLSLFVPFIIALASKGIPSIHIFVDYCFSFLIIGEILSILICIQSLKTRNKDIKEVDIYNLFIQKLKESLARYLKVDEMKKDDPSKGEKK